MTVRFLATFLTLIFCGRLYGQTRIIPPRVEFLSQSSRTDEQQSVRKVSTDIEAPIPFAFGIGMPFLRANGRWSQLEDAEGAVRRKRDFVFSLGMLHHAAEGAPWWKFEAGRFGCLECRGFWTSRGALNLEKAFPSLRPYNSDKLEAWLGAAAVSGENGRTYFLPEFGWTWRSTDRWLFEFVAPYSARIGMEDREWLGAATWRQDIVPTTDKDTPSGVQLERSQYVFAQAGRRLAFGLNVLLSAGVKLPNTATAAVEIGWRPSD